MTRRYNVFLEISSNMDDNVKSKLEELMSKIEDYYFYYSTINDTKHYDVFYYLYLEDEYYTNIDIATILGCKSPTTISRIAVEINQAIIKIIYSLDEYKCLRTFIK